MTFYRNVRQCPIFARLLVYGAYLCNRLVASKQTVAAKQSSLSLGQSPALSWRVFDNFL